jgi:conjugative transfer protein CagX
MDQTTLSQTAHRAAVRVCLVPALALLAACASHTAPETPADAGLVRATLIAESPPPAPSPSPTGELVPPDDPEIQAAMRAWKAGQPAPIIRTTEFIQYPYGLTEAIVTCEPLRVCDVELDAGEEIQNVSIGDTSRWLVHPAFSGGRETLTPHVMVKPTEYDITTNAIVTTNRRTYYLGLVSKARSDPGYVRRVKFYCPPLGQELGQTANELIRRGINVAPTLEIRPGYPFNVMVTQDLVFPGPYAETGRP